MTKTKLKLFTVLFALLAHTAVYSQVTIGRDNEPVEGALLQLEQMAVTGNNVNSEKGLGMPRVNLSNIDKLKMGTAAELTGAEVDKHTGLVVFNVNECLADLEGNILGKGLYVWNGMQWDLLGEKYAPEVKVFVDPRDGEEYLYRDFGNDAGVWMLQNMRATKFTNGEVINPFVNITSTDPAYSYPQQSGTNWGTKPATWLKVYGLLYNSYAANNRYEGSSSQEQRASALGTNEVEKDSSLPNQDRDGNYVVQGICPKGWHIPSDREWNKLEKEIYDNADKYSEYFKSDIPFSAGAWQSNWEYGLDSTPGYGERGSSDGTGHAEAMKSPCPLAGSSISARGKSYTPQRGGFNAVPVGRVEMPGAGPSINYYGQASFFWSSSTYMGNKLYRMLRNTNSTVKRGRAPFNNLMSVRCKMD